LVEILYIDHQAHQLLMRYAMLDFLRRFATVVSSEAIAYRAVAYGEKQPNRMWNGYVVFLPADGGRALITPRETTQSTWQSLLSWAAGLSPIYLEGALHRALAVTPEAQLERRLSEIERIEADAYAQATALERAAETARAEASLAHRKRAQTERALATARAEAAAENAMLHEQAATRARAEARAALREAHAKGL
jgi:hypothetical protein